MIEVLPDLLYQNPRNYVGIIHAGSFRIYIINRKALICWVAVKEFRLSCHTLETVLFAIIYIYPYNGNSLSAIQLKEAQQGFQLRSLS